MKKIWNCELLPVWLMALSPIVIMLSDRIVNILDHNNSQGNYLFDLLIEIFGSAIGLGGAVWLFLRQIDFDNKENLKLKQKKDDDLILYSQYLIENGDSWTNKQIKLLIKYCRSIKRNPYSIPKIEFDPDQAFYRLNGLFSTTEYFHTYLSVFNSSKENIKNYKNIEDCVNYFTNVQKQIFEMRLETIHKYNMRIYEITSMINNIYLELNDVANNTSITSLSDMIKKYIPNISIDTSQDVDKIFQSYKIIQQQLILNFSGIPGAIHMIDTIFVLGTKIKELTENVKSNKRDYTRVISYFIEMRKKLKKNNADIKNFKRRIN